MDLNNSTKHHLRSNPRKRVSTDGQENGYSEEVGPHVACLVVKLQQRDEARPIRKIDSVTGGDVGIVLLVRRGRVEVHRPEDETPDAHRANRR